MGRFLVWVLLSFVVGALAGCTNSAGPTAADDLGSYWIEGYYCYYPSAVRTLSWESCAVYVRSGGQSGNPVPGLAVTCNGQALTYANPVYHADVSDIAPGEDVTFEVSDGGHSLSLTLVVPAPPVDLDLLEDSWDFSDPQGTHTLTWTNPPSVADSILVSVGGRGSHPFDLHVYQTRVPASATEIVLSNTNLADFAETREISCAVSQEVRGSLASHHGGGALWARAGVVADWPR